MTRFDYKVAGNLRTVILNVLMYFACSKNRHLVLRILPMLLIKSLTSMVCPQRFYEKFILDLS